MKYKSAFTDKVYAVVTQIPQGRVMTYGQIAALIGHPMASRQVGGTAHFGATYLHTTPDCPHAQHAAPPEFLANSVVVDSSTHSASELDASLRASPSPSYSSRCEGCGGPLVPWHRVVNKQGGLASGYPGGRLGHKQHLESEGVAVQGEGDNYFIDIEQYIWWPDVSEAHGVMNKEQ